MVSWYAIECRAVMYSLYLTRNLDPLIYGLLNVMTTFQATNLSFYCDPSSSAHHGGPLQTIVFQQDVYSNNRMQIWRNAFYICGPTIYQCFTYSLVSRAVNIAYMFFFEELMLPDHVTCSVKTKKLSSAATRCRQEKRLKPFIPKIRWTGISFTAKLWLSTSHYPVYVGW